MFDCIKGLISGFSSFYKVEKIDDLVILTPKDPKIPITSSLIFMHGLGDTAEGYLSTFQSPSRPVPNNCRVVLPTAPLARVTISGGEYMNSWYDIKGFSNENDVSEKDINKNSEDIMKLVDKEASLFNGNYKKVYIGGFSQGASLAFNIGLNKKELIGGIIALSGCLFPFCTKNVNVKDKRELPIYIAHGKQDDVIEFSTAMLSYEYFEKNKFTNVKINEFIMGHSICSKELKEMKDFIFINSIKYLV